MNSLHNLVDTSCSLHQRFKIWHVDVNKTAQQASTLYIGPYTAIKRT